ncbi:MAG: aminotransferase class V-fold PLP-dependent enzyme, partial [Chloroflexi bacterium]|nr:aminotransferase class V-fold PLP-dependent enzyme [Chloroflexota bacterium]
MLSFQAVIYLDHNATTPVAPEVLEAMMPYLTSEWGNPSSSYKFGAKLKTVIETAREQVAELIGASGREIIFTSCATESNNTAIHAALKANPGKRHIVTLAVEHSSVLNYCRALEGNRESHETHEMGSTGDPPVVSGDSPDTLSITDLPLTRPADTLSHPMGERRGEGDSSHASRSSGRESAPSSAPKVQSRLTSAATVEEGGYRVTYLPVDREGLLKLADLENAITD